MADGQVVFEIKGDSSSINQTVKQVTSNIQSESKKWDQAAGTATGGIEKSFASMTGKVVGMLGAAGIGSILLNWGKSAVEAASDLAEVQNVVDTVFGSGANQIEAWARKAGDQFGLTETQAKKFTSTLGAMMKSSGIAGDEIVEMSTDLAGLAADMASFYNLDFETSFEKIRSGISGETMPLKQLGINMSVANLEAFALAQGLEKTFSQMDQGEQTMLRYQYLMKATADAQGDFERTSDGFANAQRKIQSAIDSIQTSIGKIFLPAIESALSNVSTFLSNIASSMVPERTIFDEFNDAEVNTAEKLADLQSTYEKASDLIKILGEIETKTVTLNTGETVNLTDIFGDLAEIEKSGGSIQEYIEGLGLDVNYVVSQYDQWKEATRQLTSLVPDLASAIDSETGAIDGGTEALQRNLDAWKKNEENKIYWAEYYAKAEAVARAKGEQAGIQIEAKARQMAAEREAKNLADTYGTVFDETGKVLDRFTGDHKLEFESGAFNFAEVDDQFENYNRLLDEADKCQKKADQSANDLADAEALLADELKATEKITGQTLETVEKVADATSYAGKTTEEWEKALEKAPDAAKAIQAVIDYYHQVNDATKQAVNSTLKGFEEISKAGDDLREKQTKIGEEAAETELKYADIFSKWGGSDFNALQKMADSWDTLTDAEKEAYNALTKIRNEQKEVNDQLDHYKPEGMTKSLQSQIQFMEEYLQNLDQLKEWGVSDEMIASLSDGSKESAEFLHGLVEGGPEAAKAVGELYSEVQKKKDSFADALTENKLAADDAFNGLVETAKKAMDGLDFGEEAKTAVGNSVQGIIDGIGEKVPGVKAQVDALLAVLSPLDGLGFSFGFSDGGFSLKLNGKHETGLDFVPFDGYLAELHEGEGILTSEENRIWQRFKNGQSSNANVDYDALGGVMRDNVKAGGNVYLDGRTVGHVVSDIQGNQYRSLQRSGWQG